MVDRHNYGLDRVHVHVLCRYAQNNVIMGVFHTRGYGDGPLFGVIKRRRGEGGGL